MALVPVGICVPKFIGVLLVIDGLGWLVDGLHPYFFPQAPMGFLNITELGEMVFMIWLLARGWKIRQQVR